LVPELQHLDPVINESLLSYMLQISVEASDNNVETGGSYYGDEGKLIPGTTRRNKNGYLTFLVVSEDDLLRRSGQEENVLLAHLDDTLTALKRQMDTLDEQHGRFAVENFKENFKIDMIDPIFLRVSGVRADLDRVGKKLLQVHQSYANIMNVMKVNRVPDRRIGRIRQTVVQPLQSIIGDGKERSAFNRAEVAVLTAYELVEKDRKAWDISDPRRHQQNLAEASQQVKVLRDDIKRIIDALSIGIKESQLRNQARYLAEEQERETRRWEKLLQEEILRLLGPQETPKAESEPKQKK